MNSSAAVTAEVPAAVVSCMSTTLAAAGGAVATHVMLELHETALAVVAPNVAVVLVAVKPVPVIVTTVPPDVGPVVGVIEVIVGGSW